MEIVVLSAGLVKLSKYENCALKKKGRKDKN